MSYIIRACRRMHVMVCAACSLIGGIAQTIGMWGARRSGLVRKDLFDFPLVMELGEAVPERNSHFAVNSAPVRSQARCDLCSARC